MIEWTCEWKDTLHAKIFVVIHLIDNCEGQESRLLAGHHKPSLSITPQTLSLFLFRKVRAAGQQIESSAPTPFTTAALRPTTSDSSGPTCGNEILWTWSKKLLMFSGYDPKGRRSYSHHDVSKGTTINEAPVCSTKRCQNEPGVWFEFHLLSIEK